MKFCTYCGGRLEDGASFCPNCGARVESVERDSFDTFTTEAEPSLAESVFGATDAKLGERSRGIAVLAFFFPVVGLILWALWRDTKPGKATSAAKGALVSVCVGSPIIGLVAYLILKDSHPELSKTAAIAAIVGVAFSVLCGILGFVLGLIGAFSGFEAEGGYYLISLLLGAI